MKSGFIFCCLHVKWAIFVFFPKSSLQVTYVDVKDVPHTNLKTGTPYLIINKANSGRLTWNYAKVTSEKSGLKYNYAQVVFGNAAATDFVLGKKYYEDTLWYLIPTEVEDGYIIRNVARPDAVLTWVDAGTEAKGFLWVVLKLSHAPEKDKDYAEGGQFRADAIWKFMKNNDGSYGIYNSRQNGVMTFDNDVNVADGKKYCKIITSGGDYTNKPEYSWKFMPQGSTAKLNCNQTCSCSDENACDCEPLMAPIKNVGGNFDCLEAKCNYCAIKYKSCEFNSTYFPCCPADENLSCLELSETQKGYKSPTKNMCLPPCHSYQKFLSCKDSSGKEYKGNYKRCEGTRPKTWTYCASTSDLTVSECGAPGANCAENTNNPNATIKCCAGTKCDGGKCVAE